VTRKAFSLCFLLSALITGFALGRVHTPSKSSSTHQVLYYVDPMHPAYRSSKPGIAPDCGMDLIPVYSEDVARSLLPSGASSNGALYIDSVTQQLYGIRLSRVQKTSGQETIRVFGKVAPDETRVYRVNLGTDGYVKETHDDAVGNHVKKDQHLAIVYSPEFLSVTSGYLSANERTPGASPKDAAASVQNSASAQARADRLRNLGMSDVQIEEVSATRKLPEDVYVVSPTDGFILSRNISPGLRFERRSDLYTVADLSHVWILAEIFGTDSKAFRPGAIVRVTLPDTGEAFKARVSNVLPEVDPASHTLKLRLEAENAGFRLRPDMFVNVELPMALPAGLSVPVDAILDSGLSKRVFVQTSKGYFASREVQTGWRLEDSVQVVKGLDEGEIVASAGTFLIDSESRMQLAANSGKATLASSRNEIALGTLHAKLHP
jgi:membrane fusion protein, copper/silver efflux system